MTQLQWDVLVTQRKASSCPRCPAQHSHINLFGPDSVMWPHPACRTTRRWTARPPTSSRTHLSRHRNVFVHLVSRHVKVTKGSFYSYLSSCSNQRGPQELSLCQFSTYESDSPSLPCQPHLTLNFKPSQHRGQSILFLYLKYISLLNKSLHEWVSEWMGESEGRREEICSKYLICPIGLFWFFFNHNLFSF